MLRNSSGLPKNIDSRRILQSGTGITVVGSVGARQVKLNIHGLVDIVSVESNDQVLIWQASSGSVKRASVGALLLASLSAGQLDVFLPGTQYVWVKPDGAQYVLIHAIGAGGGGGSGRKTSVAVPDGGGGGGGGGGASAQAFLPASAIPGVLSIAVGRGGAGGLGAIDAHTNGTAGGAGGSSIVRSMLTKHDIFAGAGGGGSGGGTASSAGGSAGTGDFRSGISAQGATGDDSSVVRPAGGSSTFWNAGAGGAGAGISSVPALASAGSDGGSANGFAGGIGGLSGATVDAMVAPTDGHDGSFACGGGGGGGSGGCSFLDLAYTGAASAFTGGAGGWPGGGGGGGGSVYETPNIISGSGGYGADGSVIIFTFF